MRVAIQFVRLLASTSLPLALIAPMSVAAEPEAAKTALAAAAPYVKAGFSVRKDRWKGAVDLGEKKAVRHQLFKGNEYWFWVGSATPGVKLSVKVYDSKGRRIDVETQRSSKSASARVLAPKTGSYYIVVSASRSGASKPQKSSGTTKVEWSMVYGFR